MTKSELIHRIETCVPKLLVRKYRLVKRYFYWQKQQVYNRKALGKLRKKKGPIETAFLVTCASIWKYDSIFKLMQKDACFHPFVLVAPNLWLSDNNMNHNLELAIKMFQEKGYETYSLKDIDKKTFLKKFHPDILFYTRPYSETYKYLDVHRLYKCLKCFVNYGFISIIQEWGIASAFHGLMWKIFGECEANKQLALMYQPRELQNMVVTGYPIFDTFNESANDSVFWKNSSKNYKRVIWAPHHSIEGMTGMLQFSTFLLYYDFMLKLAEQYRDKVQFVFKPHPLLKDNLYSHPDWGQKRTDEYYNLWRNGENTNIEEGGYVELFKSSDAMIHDCGSFIVEYLYTQKPVMFLSNFDRDGQSNQVGKDAFAAHYHGYSKEDINDFINKIVIEGQDDMFPKRESFYKHYLLPPNNCSVAENVLNEIKKELQL